MKLSKFIFLFSFAFIFSIIPWEALYAISNGDGFVDKKIYLDPFLYEDNLSRINDVVGFFGYISGEFLWYFIIDFLVNKVGISLDVVFISISFLTIYVFACLISRWGEIYHVIFLFNPLVVDFAFSQYRMALAMSLLGGAYILFEKYKKTSFILLLLTVFIHTGSFIFIFIYVFVLYLKKANFKRNLNATWIYIFSFAFGVIISILIGPLRDFILSIIGDRRAEYSDMSSTIKYSLFWIFLLIPFYFNKLNLLKYDYSIYALITISIVAFNVLHGGYSMRFLSAAFPSIVASIAAFKGRLRIFIFSMFFLYAVLQWLYWLQIMGGV
ncbi:EpsG family protein [Comamonas terrae]|uniref:EpsG family protein n=1 Tax=Comamonas terrae TaxID=673548 RepID=A0ABW5UM81_9BURK|nr:EpsG family protein [Comamonas terrae]